jgi:hypothetical protein
LFDIFPPLTKEYENAKKRFFLYAVRLNSIAEGRRKKEEGRRKKEKGKKF